MKNMFKSINKIVVSITLLLVLVVSPCKSVVLASSNVSIVIKDIEYSVSDFNNSPIRTTNLMRREDAISLGWAILCWNEIPKNVQDYVKSTGITIEIVNDIDTFLNNTYGLNINDSVCGSLVYSGKTMYGIYLDNSFYGSVVITHEIGHLIDHTYNPLKSLTDEKEFIDIYNAEKNYMIDEYEECGEYYKSSIREYFAEAFKLYLEYLSDGDGSADDCLMKEKAPMTYDYMSKLINEMKVSTK